jgi:hypothetical protein
VRGGLWVQVAGLDPAVPCARVSAHPKNENTKLVAVRKP